MAETIREFLVGIGFKVDGNSEAKFSRAVETATKAVVALGASAAAVATTVTAAVTKIAAGFDDLYYASQRTKASAENIKAIGYAVSQLGGSYQGAVASLEAFTQKLRSNPGYESLAKSIGVVTRENGRLRDTTALMTDIARTLDRRYSGDSRFDMIKDGRGIPAFDPARLARIQGNAAMGKGSFGLGGPILVPQANNATSVDMQQKTEITILGGSDPQATAQAVAGAQDKVNGGMIRNMQGAVR